MPNRSLLVLISCVLASACGQTRDSEVGSETGGNSTGGTVVDSGAPNAHGGSAGSEAGGAASDTDAGIPNDAASDGGMLVDASLDAEAPVDGSTLAHPYRVLQITAGALHACALLEDHRVKCWGNNFIGQLGYGDKKDRGRFADEMGDALPFVDLGTGRTAKAIAAGRYTTCAILDDGSVKCWGLNEGYEPSGDTHGEAPGQMGDQLPAVDLGEGRKATHLTVKEHQGCIALDDDTIRCWGVAAGTYAIHPTAPVRQMTPSNGGVVVLLEDGTLIKVPQGTLEALRGSTAIGGSPAGYCAVGGPEGLMCSGSVFGNIQVGVQGLIGVGIGDIGPTHVCTLSANGEASCQNTESSLGDCVEPGAPYWCGNDGHTVDLGQPATNLTTDSRGFECALLADGSVKCWGEAAAPLGILGGSVEATPDGGVDAGVVWNPIDLGTKR
jgi:hypothetical protein